MFGLTGLKGFLFYIAAHVGVAGTAACLNVTFGLLRAFDCL